MFHRGMEQSTGAIAYPRKARPPTASLFSPIDGALGTAGGCAQIIVLKKASYYKTDINRTNWVLKARTLKRNKNLIDL